MSNFVGGFFNNGGVDVLDDGEFDGVFFNNGGGFHQITLGYDFLGNRPEPYDCNCPAIN